MADIDKVVWSQMRSLVKSFDCDLAAAETIAARWGGSANSGTICKKRKGHLDFTIPDMIALEDANDQYPVTRMLWRRTQGSSPTNISLIQQSGVISKEGGEALAAILLTQQSGSEDDAANAVTEIDQAIAAYREARSIILARSNQ